VHSSAPADTPSAACSPPTTEPPATSEPHKATPITLPVWRIVFSVPDAAPERARSTDPSSSEVISGTTSPTPAPNATSWTTIAAYGVSAPKNPSAAQPAAARTVPSSMTARAPILRARRPAPMLVAITIPVIGANASPVSSGERPCARWKYRLSTKISP